MPETLFGAGAQLLESSAGTASDINKQKQEATKTTVDAGASAGSEIGARQRQQMSGQQAQQLEMLKSKLTQQENLMTITPQIALGLAKHSKNPDWLKAVGTQMRSDVVLGLYTAESKAHYTPRYITKQDGDQVSHGWSWFDPDTGQEMFVPSDKGGPKYSPTARGEVTPKDKSKVDKKGKDDTLKKNEDFMRSHEKQAALFNDPVKANQLKTTNPDQYNRMYEEYQKDQDRYDQLKTSMGAAGGPAVPASGANPDQGSAPFDADAFIKEAVGGQ